MMATWQLGESFVVLLAALKGISVRWYEAAAIDGASRWQAFWYITWPLLSPWLGLLVLRDVVLSFQNTFTANWLMTGGDPYYATLFLPLHIYSEAFDHLRLNLGAALTVIVVALTALIIVLLLTLLPSLQVEQEV
jgi:multiple sugar transport system permease protein